MSGDEPSDVGVGALRCRPTKAAMLKSELSDVRPRAFRCQGTSLPISIPKESPSSSQALDDREDVALGVLEPCALGAASRRDAILRLQAGVVVLLEDDAFAQELAHLAFEVLDLPERLARQRRAGVRR